RKRSRQIELLERILHLPKQSTRSASAILFAFPFVRLKLQIPRNMAAEAAIGKFQEESLEFDRGDSVGILVRVRVIAVDGELLWLEAAVGTQQIEVWHAQFAPELLQVFVDELVFVIRAESVHEWEGHDA